MSCTIKDYAWESPKPKPPATHLMSLRPHGSSPRTWASFRQDGEYWHCLDLWSEVQRRGRNRSRHRKHLRRARIRRRGWS